MVEQNEFSLEKKKVEAMLRHVYGFQKRDGILTSKNKQAYFSHTFVHFIIEGKTQIKTDRMGEIKFRLYPFSDCKKLIEEMVFDIKPKEIFDFEELKGFVERGFSITRALKIMKKTHDTYIRHTTEEQRKQLKV